MKKSLLFTFIFALFIPVLSFSEVPKDISIQCGAGPFGALVPDSYRVTIEEYWPNFGKDIFHIDIMAEYSGMYLDPMNFTFLRPIDIKHKLRKEPSKYSLEFATAAMKFREAALGLPPLNFKPEDCTVESATHTFSCFQAVGMGPNSDITDFKVWTEYRPVHSLTVLPEIVPLPIITKDNLDLFQYETFNAHVVTVEYTKDKVHKHRYQMAARTDYDGVPFSYCDFH